MTRLRFALAAVFAGAIAAVSALPAAGIGILAPSEPGLPPLYLKSQEVRVTIADQAAKTHVAQVFHNPHDRQLEAYYLFPVPKGAQITDFVLYMNGKPVRAEVVESGKARQIYEDIVRTMRDPGLLEYIDRDLFRVRVFPVPARGDTKIEIEFAQVLPLDGAAVQYVFPAATRPGAPKEQPTQFSFKFSIDSKSPIKTVYSPSHEIKTERKGENHVEGASSGSGADPRRDLTLVYTLGGGQVGMSGLAYRDDPARDGYFMVMIAPQAKLTEAEIQAKAVTFVLDSSGSMLDDGKIDQARAALLYCVAKLRDKDVFNVVRFATEVEPFREGLVPATEENRRVAKGWIQKIEAKGGTNIDEALATALKSAVPQGMAHMIVLLTDGKPTIGVTNPQEMADNLEKRNAAQARVFTFGVGFDVNAPLLDRLAEDTRAVSQYIKPGEDIEVAVSSFFDKVSSPVLTNLDLSIQGVKAYDIFPRQLPDLFLGTQLVVLGRYKEAGKAKVSLTGNLAGKAHTFAFDTVFPEEETRQDYIEPLWGHRKVGYLLEEIRRNGESEELVKEVIELAKRYGIATPYTSLLATEDTPQAQGARQQLDGKASGQVRVLRSSAKPPYAYGAGAAGRAAPALGQAPGAMPEKSFSAGDRLSMQESGQLLADAAQPMGAKQPRSESFFAQSGAGAVAASEQLRNYKEAEKAGKDEGAAALRRASGRDFESKDGVWTDRSIKARDKVLKVKYLSQAYFDLVRLRPDLKEALALGEKVEIRLDDRTVLSIGTEGEQTLSDANRTVLESTKPKGAAAK